MYVNTLALKLTFYFIISLNQKSENYLGNFARAVRRSSNLVLGEFPRRTGNCFEIKKNPAHINTTQDSFFIF